MERIGYEPTQTPINVARNNRKVTSCRAQGAKNEESNPAFSTNALGASELEENRNASVIPNETKRAEKLTTSIQVDGILNLGGAITAQLSACKMGGIFGIYKEFFQCLHNIITIYCKRRICILCISSIYNKLLVSDRKCTASPAYQYFTAPVV